MKAEFNALIEEGKKLEKTFTREAISFKLTTDRQAISNWITKCLMKIEKIETNEKMRAIYEKFSISLKKISNLDLDEFKELIGCLEGIEETLKEDDDKDEEDPNDPLVYS